MTAYISVELQRRIRVRFGNACAYCRTAEHLTATSFEFEHIMPRSAGGLTEFENLCLSCPMRNRYKSDQNSGIDPQSHQSSPLFHPHHDRWEDHFAWGKDGTELIGATAKGRATVIALKINRPQMIRIRRMWIALNEHPPQD
jgi:hypothetical protein